jgi:hypothetical protein
MTRTAAGADRLASQLPEPGRFWIRYVPRAWDFPDRPWIDLSSGALGGRGRGAPAAGRADFTHLAETPLDDLLYLPPVPARRAAARDEVARTRLMGGTPVLVHLLPGEESGVPPVAGVAFVVDLLPALLERELDRLLRVPPHAVAVWPLLPGLTDDPAFWDLGCRHLAAAGVAGAQPVTPALEAGDRRRLAERWSRGDDAVFDALFHREPPPERAFARVAHAHGLAPFLPRPLPRPPVQGVANRRIAGVLALTAELWLRLGRSAERGHAVYRSARWIDRTSYDLEALAREGNLAVLDPVDALSRELIAECVERDGEPRLLEELLAEYLEGPILEAPGEAGPAEPATEPNESAPEDPDEEEMA